MVRTCVLAALAVAGLALVAAVAVAMLSQPPSPRLVDPAPAPSSAQP